MPFFTGLVGGISEGLARSRAEAAARAERQSQLEGSILQHLSTSTDPEISSRAIAGLLGQADPTTARKSKGLRGFLGETEGNPALPMLRDFIARGRQVEVPDEPPSLTSSPGVSAEASPPPVTPTPGAAALPINQQVQPGLRATAPPGPATTQATRQVTVPRQVFRTPDEQAALTHTATTTADIESKLGAMRRNDMTDTERVAIFGHGVNPATWWTTGTVQGKDLPPGTTDHTGRPTTPDQHYTRRVNPQDPAQATYFPVQPPASVTNQAAIAARPTFQHMVGPDGKSPGVWRVSRDGSRPAVFVGYSGARSSYLQYVDPQTQEVTYVSAPAQFTPMAELPSSPTPPAAPGAGGAPGAGAAMGPAGAAGPPPGPQMAAPTAASAPAQAPGAAPATGVAPAPGPRGISGGRKRDLQTVEGAFMGPDGPVAGTAFLDKGLGQYFSSQDPTQPAQGFIPGELGSYATTAYHQANATLITIERAIQAIDDAGLAKNTNPAATAALMAKFYGGTLGDNPIAEAAASLTNLAGIQGATQYVRSNSRSYQMFQAALMHLPRSPSEAVAQRSTLPVVGGLITPRTTGMVGGHGWDSPAAMRTKLELAQGVIQQGKASLSELIGKAPERAVGQPPPGGQAAAAPAAGAASKTVRMRAPDGTERDVPQSQVAKAQAAGAVIVQ